MSASPSPSPTEFNAQPILSYLGLPSEHTPSPSIEPVKFLSAHLRELSPNLLAQFSLLLTPQQRTILPAIRNRRQKYASTIPKELSFDEARKRWPSLWGGRDRPGIEQAKEEKLWADREFLGGQKGQVGKLGHLLSEYEEQREAERFRHENMAQRFAGQSLGRGMGEEGEEEEEEEEEDENEAAALAPALDEEETPDQLRINFERLIRERFIYGLLDDADYDAIDWDDKWDEINEQDSEERWFDAEEDEEGHGVLPLPSSSQSFPDLDPPPKSVV